MSAGIWFWIIYVLCLLFGVWSVWPTYRDSPRVFGGGLVVFILLGLLGWRVFGPPIQ